MADNNLLSIVKSLENYNNDVIKAIDKAILDSAKTIVKEIEKKAPRSFKNRNPHLADSFIYEVERTKNEIKAFIFSEKKGYIAHFLEYGTTKIKPQPFLRPIYDIEAPKLQAKIKKIIENGG